jgi:hypothetical protein
MVFWKIIYMKRKKIYILYSLFFLFFRSIYIYAQNKIEENYTLKSGYELSVTNQRGDSLLYFFLKNGNFMKNIITENQIYINDTVLWKKYNSRYEGIDFTNYFCITYFIANSMQGIELYEKKTGTDFFHGKCLILCGENMQNRIAYRIKEELLLCLQINNNQDDGTILLIDLKNSHIHKINIHQLVNNIQDTYFWHSVYIKNVNSQYAIITYNNGFSKPISLKLKRIKSPQNKLILDCKNYNGELKENRVNKKNE